MSASSSLKSLNNGQFELAVSAATGRIVHYGAVRGANVLWKNPRADSVPSPFVGWHNWGGDKVWIWPEDDWVKWQAGVVAPPGDPPPPPAAAPASAADTTSTVPYATSSSERSASGDTMRRDVLGIAFHGDNRENKGSVEGGPALGAATA